MVGRRSALVWAARLVRVHWKVAGKVSRNLRLFTSSDAKPRSWAYCCARCCGKMKAGCVRREGVTKGGWIREADWDQMERRWKQKGLPRCGVAGATRL